MLIWIVVIVASVFADQLTKQLVVNFLDREEPLYIIKDVLRFSYVENRGAAFGMLDDHRWVFMILSTVVMVVIIYVMFKYKRFFHPILMTGLSFTVGGGIGNMIDRTVNGFVVDFFDFTLIDFAVFNLADTFICIGVGLIFLDILLGKSDYSFLDDKKQIIDSEKDRNDDTDTDR